MLSVYLTTVPAKLSALPHLFIFKWGTVQLCSSSSSSSDAFESVVNIQHQVPVERVHHWRVRRVNRMESRGVRPPTVTPFALGGGSSRRCLEQGTKIPAHFRRTLNVDLLIWMGSRSFTEHTVREVCSVQFKAIFTRPGNPIIIIMPATPAA